MKLPVSVISPVRNCVGEMPAHAAHLTEMAEAAAEVIVVDSDSNDGTLEYLKDKLAGLNVKFLNHPPGLYQSWNFAISKATQPYLTVATVGDQLPVESLHRLVETLEKFSADAVISAPKLIDEKAQPIKRRWPIHQVVAEAKITEPRVMSPAEWMTLTLGFFPGNLLSSSAGNLYVTKLMQENPFPTDYGHAGDCTWALAMSRKAKWVIDPLVLSYFWVHAATAHRKRRSEKQVRGVSKMVKDYLAVEIAFLRDEGVPADLLEIIGRVPDQLIDKALIQIEYASVRKSYLPRFLQPRAAKLKREQSAIDQLIEARHERTRAFARTLAS